MTCNKDMLDPDYIKRAAPPGSMRYFALLYAAADQRELLTALFVIDAEIRASATHAAHEVAHTRLQWWRAEIDRLINRNAQHPATQVVQAALPTADFSILHELLVAADMDVSRMTYNNSSELNGYLERSGGVLQLAVSDNQRKQARQLGALIRRVETLRDLSMDVRDGRAYWPLDQLEAEKVTIEHLRSPHPSNATNSLLAGETARIGRKFEELEASSRPLAVLARLHAQLLRRIERAHHDVFTQRHELGPLEKIWTAWRAARRS